MLRSFGFYTGGTGISFIIFVLSTKTDERTDPDGIFHNELNANMVNKTAAEPDPSIKQTIISLLKSTGRENIDKMIAWMENNSFFEAAGSRDKHNAFRGGLAKHSLDVYNEAMKLNKTQGLPVNSIIICSLLHDVCKADQYYIDSNGKPQCDKNKRDKGHGLRSLFIVTRGAQLPLNFDEAMAIWWHMGEYEDSLKKHSDKYLAYYKESIKNKLCKLIHKADGIAAGQALASPTIPA